MKHKINTSMLTKELGVAIRWKGFVGREELESREAGQEDHGGKKRNGNEGQNQGARVYNAKSL